ncbi:NUDIX domain-containing protein [Sporolactobacillus sp. THM7-4]|nr:NUDIX domain-containing protein [Sporolactobacillus sp. THM7-4]
MGYIEDLREKIGHMPVILLGCVGIIMDQEGRVLLQQRNEKRKRWGLPGGLMEPGESAEETVKREIFEETHLVVEEVRLLNVYSGKDYHVIADNGDEYYVVTCAYFCDSWSGSTVQDKKETLQLRFFDHRKLPENMVGSHKRILKNYTG